MQRSIAGAIFSLLILPQNAVAADTAENRANSSYDRPIAQTSRLTMDAASQQKSSLRCYTYPAFRVMRIDTNTPLGDASIFLQPGHFLHRRCTLTDAAQSIQIGTKGQFFAGVRDKYIILQEADPNGPVEFTIYNFDHRKVFYTDAMIGADLRLSSLRDRGLRVRYKKGIAAGCSMIEEPVRCWEKAKNTFDLPHSITQGGSPLATCKATYAKQSVVQTNPSLIGYDVDLVLHKNGKAAMQPTSALSCDPMP